MKRFVFAELYFVFVLSSINSVSLHAVYVSLAEARHGVTGTAFKTSFVEAIP